MCTAHSDKISDGPVCVIQSPKVKVSKWLGAWMPVGQRLYLLKLVLRILI